MVVASSGDILGILEASRDLAITIPGIKSAFVTTSTVPPEQIHLPAVMQHVGLEELDRAIVTFGGREQRIEFQFALDVLVARTGDIADDHTAALPFVELVLQAYREHLTLGNPSVVERCWPINFRFVTISYGDQTFFGVRFVMSVSAMTVVALSA